MARRDVSDVLRKARLVLSHAQLGLADLGGPDPTRRLAGLHNAMVWGRAVTSVLQNLRSIQGLEFNAWYEPRRAQMARDPLLRFFYRRRSEALKEGGPTTTQRIHVRHLRGSDLTETLQDPPPGAVSFFIGDELGGNGWIVRLPDGTEAKHYVALPASVDVHHDLFLPDPPKEHLGQPIADPTALNLTRLYIAYLSELVSDAEVEFLR